MFVPSPRRRPTAKLRQNWTPNSSEGEIAKAAIAFQGEVIAADPEAAPSIYGFEQKLTFRVMHSWKGSNRAGDTVILTVHVVNVCGG